MTQLERAVQTYIEGLDRHRTEPTELTRRMLEAAGMPCL